MAPARSSSRCSLHSPRIEAELRTSIHHTGILRHLLQLLLIVRATEEPQRQTAADNVCEPKYSGCGADGAEYADLLERADS